MDTWSDDPVNNNSVLLDAIAGSVTTKSLTNANVSLTTTECQVSILRFTGSISGNITITLASIIKSWIVENTTDGAFVVKLSGGSGNQIGLPPGSCQVYWDGTNVQFINLDKIGSYWDCAATAVPAWVTACTVPPYLLCDGSSFSNVTYPLLNRFLGGTTLPDARGRSRFALNGGTSRITTAGSGIDGDTLKSAGGAQNIAISQANLPNVNFTVTDPTHFHGMSGFSIGGGSGTIASGSQGFTITTSTGAASTGISVNSGGSGTAVNEMPPAYIGGITMIRAA